MTTRSKTVAFWFASWWGVLRRDADLPVHIVQHVEKLRSDAVEKGIRVEQSR